MLIIWIYNDTLLNPHVEIPPVIGHYSLPATGHFLPGVCSHAHTHPVTVKRKTAFLIRIYQIKYISWSKIQGENSDYNKHHEYPWLSLAWSLATTPLKTSTRDSSCYCTGTIGWMDTVHVSKKGNSVSIWLQNKQILHKKSECSNSI